MRDRFSTTRRVTHQNEVRDFPFFRGTRRFHGVPVVASIPDGVCTVAVCLHPGIIAALHERSVHKRTPTAGQFQNPCQRLQTTAEEDPPPGRLIAGGPLLYTTLRCTAGMERGVPGASATHEPT